MVAVGDRLPDGLLYFMDDAGVLQLRSIRSLFSGKRAILIGMTGAFTPACSVAVSDFMSKATQFNAKGVSCIYCLSVNDAFVVKAWAETYKGTSGREHVLFLADGSATFTKALGLETDLTRYGFGVCSRRFVLFVDNMIVRIVSVEAGDSNFMTADELLQRFI